ncbi:hypothetical protein ACV30S_13400 [Clostridium perfringens]
MESYLIIFLGSYFIVSLIIKIIELSKSNKEIDQAIERSRKFLEK